MHFCLWLAAVFYGIITTVTALSTIEAVGNKFFTEDGTQFFMKGIAYQLLPDDPLVDTEQCTRDASLMKTLGANTIRVYHVDPAKNHDGCMKAFADAGIYVLLDLDTFKTYILLDKAGWLKEKYDAYAQVMDAFHQYDNLLGFFVGNEVIASATQSLVAPFIKAALRDMKAYRDQKGYRKIPIGYSAADIAELRPMLQDYLTCGGNSSENTDFFALNSYEWCDPSTYETSGYQNLQDSAKNFPVPIFFSETGCNQPGPRYFNDQKAIFGEPMVNDWSGAMIYEWIQEENKYGLISYQPTGTDVFGRSGIPTPVKPDFDHLKSQWDAITPTGIARSKYNEKEAVSTRACPTSSASGWLVNGNVALPKLGDTLEPSKTTQYSTVPSATARSTPTQSVAPGSGGLPGSQESSDPSRSGSGSGPASTSSPAAENSASVPGQVTGMAAALIGVTIIFSIWL